MSRRSPPTGFKGWLHGRRERLCRILMGWALKIGGRGAFETSFQYYREIPSVSKDSAEYSANLVDRIYKAQQEGRTGGHWEE